MLKFEHHQIHPCKLDYSIILHNAINQEQSNLPKVITPLPALSNSRKATMKRESGAHSTDSNATNSGREISLIEERRRIGKRLVNALI